MCEKFGIMNIIDEEWEENDVQEYYSCKTLCTYIKTNYGSLVFFKYNILNDLKLKDGNKSLD